MTLHPTGLPLGGSATTCGSCTWVRSGTCGLLAPDNRPGPAVERRGTGCLHHEPEPDCAPCGACCREAFDSVPVDDDDERTLLNRPSWIRIARRRLARPPPRPEPDRLRHPLCGPHRRRRDCDPVPVHDLRQSAVRVQRPRRRLRRLPVRPPAGRTDRRPPPSAVGRGVAQRFELGAQVLLGCPDVRRIVARPRSAAS